ncbi:MAG: LysR family transcriptional regulator [Erysipelotrichaceae bacterium]
MIIEQLKMFIEAANRQNIAQCAELFQTTKDRIRNQIIHLEKEVGYPLFVKTPRGSYLNEDGEIMYQAISKMLVEYQNAMAAINLNHSKENQLIKIAITKNPNKNYFYALHFKNNRLNDNKVEFVFLEYNDFYNALIKETVDFCFWYGNRNIQKNKSLASYSICEDQLCLIVNNDSALANLNQITIDAVIDQTIYYHPQILTPKIKQCINKLKANNNIIPLSIEDYDQPYNIIREKSACFLCHNNYAKISHRNNQQPVLLSDIKENYYLVWKKSTEKNIIAQNIIAHFNRLSK